MDYDYDSKVDDYIADMKLAEACQRRYERILEQHPDCRDPGHPGCVRCEPEHYGEEGEQ